MAQVFDRSSNALARASLVLTGLIVIALGVTLDQLQRSPWVTRQGQRADQPIPFSHKHHVEGLGLQCQYCHTHGGEFRATRGFRRPRPASTAMRRSGPMPRCCSRCGELGDGAVDPVDQGA